MAILKLSDSLYEERIKEEALQTYYSQIIAAFDVEGFCADDIQTHVELSARHYEPIVHVVATDFTSGTRRHISFVVNTTY